MQRAIDHLPISRHRQNYTHTVHMRFLMAVEICVRA
jgi:hypothetical protein